MDPSKSWKIPSCSVCKHNLLSKLEKLNKPLLLKCGHSACEDCVLKEVTVKKKVTCELCNQVSEAPLCTEANLKCEFPVNHFILGKFCERQVMKATFPKVSDSYIGFAKPSIEKKTKDIAPVKVICNECSLKADISCVQCQAPYCNKCFDSIHQNIRALKGHLRDTLTSCVSPPPDDVMLDTSCIQHPQQQVEFFCNECGISCCAHCLTTDHKRHDVSLLVEKNKELLGELLESHGKVTVIHKRLETAKKKAVKCLKRGGSSDVVEVEKEIADHFQRLHGLLIIKETEIMAKLNFPHEQCLDLLKNIVQELEGEINELDELLSVSEKVIKKGSKYLAAINISELVENLKEKEDVPCFLLSETPEKSSRFIVEETIGQSLVNHCKLEMDEGTIPRYWLSSEKELPEDYKPEVVEEVNINFPGELGNLLEARKNSTASSSSTIHSVKDSSVCGDSDIGDTEILEPGVHVKVKMSHMTSPSDFYVHTQLAYRVISSIEAKLCRMISTKNIIDVTKGKVYLVQYIQDKKWYRGRVLNIVNDEYEVIYIDYGNTEIVPKNRFRLMPSSFLNIAPLALHCRLFNCAPADGVKWSIQALSLMTQVTENCSLSMIVQRKSIDILDVDLYHYRQGSLMSLQQSLLFLGLAVLSDSCDSYMPIKKQIKKYPSRLKLCEGDTLDITTTFINTPDDFYILDVATSGKTFHSLSTDMHSVYHNSNDEKLNIYHPQIGMVVAAQSLFDSRWHRAEISDIPVTKVVQVFYLDFGITEVIPWNNIKTLLPKFFRFPPLAVHCKLSDVAPLKEEVWGEEVCKVFNLMIKDKLLKLSVGSRDKEHYSVVLYRCTPESDVCINAILVRENLAKGTGVNSTIVDYPRTTTRDLEQHDISYSVPVVLRPKKKRHPISMEPSPYEDDTQIEEGNGPVKVKIHVRRIVSPDEFYIVPVFMDKTLEKTKKSMDVFYEHQKQEDNETEWKVEDICAVKLCKRNHLWHRATILEKLDENKFKVILLDEGLEEIVDQNRMRKLTEEFQVILQASVRCHMAGITYPQKGPSWPNCTITEMKYTIDSNENEIFMTKLGDIKDRSLPVELFVRNVIPAGPFDPARYEWTSINNKLRIGGFAKADGTKAWEAEEKSFQKPWSLDEMNAPVLSAEPLVQSPSENKVKVNKYTSPAFGKNKTHLKEEKIDSPNKKDKGKRLLKKVAEGRIRKLSLEVWTPPEPFSELKFATVPTYVDHEANIYISDALKCTSTMELVEQQLEELFNDTEPNDDVAWKTGQICVARYHVNKKWYRGEVIKVTEQEIDVKFVDYGNVETCKSEELRPIAVLKEIPVLSHKCSLHTITPNFPDEIWPESALDILHASIVEKSCEVLLSELTGDSETKYGVTKLWFSDGSEFISTLVKNGYAKLKPNFEERTTALIYKPIVETSPEVIIESDSLLLNEADTNDSEDVDEKDGKVDEIKRVAEKLEQVEEYENFDFSVPRRLYWVDLLENADGELVSSGGSLYRGLEIPENKDELFVEMGAILDPTQILLLIERTNDIVLHTIKTQFEELSEKMQVEAPNQPKIQQPYLYRPCCAKFTVDGKWYRGIVVQEQENAQRVIVQYVDYGNVETVSIDELRELKDEWSDVQVQAFLCKLYNVKPCKDFDTNAIELLTNCLSYKPLRAVIKNRSPLEVELHQSDGLAYQAMLDKRYFEEEN